MSGSDDWRHLVNVIAALAVVFGTLAFGAFLQVDPTRPGPRLDSESERAAPTRMDLSEDRRPALNEHDLPTDAASATLPAPPRAAAHSGLDERASTDASRLTEPGAAWTLQFLVACDAGNVERHLSRIGDDPRTFLLPADLQGRRCYRLCWGRFRSRRDATEERTLPPALRDLAAKPIPVEIAAVTP